MGRNNVGVHVPLSNPFLAPTWLFLHSWLPLFLGKKDILLPGFCGIVLYDVPELSPYNPTHFSRGPTVTDPLTQYRGKNRCVGLRQTWFQIVVLLLTDCVTLGQLQNRSRLRFLSSKTAVVMPPNLLPAASKHWEPEMESPWQNA